MLNISVTVVCVCVVCGWRLLVCFAGRESRLRAGVRFGWCMSSALSVVAVCAAVCALGFHCLPFGGARFFLVVCVSFVLAGESERAG